MLALYSLCTHSVLLFTADPTAHAVGGSVPVMPRLSSVYGTGPWSIFHLVLRLAWPPYSCLSAYLPYHYVSSEAFLQPLCSLSSAEASLDPGSSLMRCLHGQRPMNYRRLWRRLARAPEVVVGRPAGRSLPWERRASQSCQARPEEPREPTSGTAKRALSPCIRAAMPCRRRASCRSGGSR